MRVAQSITHGSYTINHRATPSENLLEYLICVLAWCNFYRVGDKAIELG